MPFDGSPEERLLRSIFAPQTAFCVRGCTYTDPDGVEWPKEARHGELCGSCFWRIRYRLAECPKIIVALRTTMLPIKAGALEGKVDGTPDRSLPFVESQAPAADELFGILVDWANSHAEELAVQNPNASTSLPDSVWRMYLTRANSRGLTAWLSPQQAAERTDEVVRWLARWGDKIAALPSVVAYHDDIVTQVARYRSRAGLVAPRRRARSRPCPICFTETVEVVAPDEGQLVVRCAHCHLVFDPSDVVAEAVEVAA